MTKINGKVFFTLLLLFAVAINFFKASVVLAGEKDVPRIYEVEEPIETGDEG